MKKTYQTTFRLAVIAVLFAVGVIQADAQFSMQIVADNDFAVFGGTATSVNDLIYQNDYSWPDQINNLSTLTFDLPAGDTTIYLLGMGGGGQENISGTINGLDITTFGDIAMSSDLSSYLTGYLVSDGNGGLMADSSVAYGTYDASLADVQTAFPNLTWGSPSINYDDNVIQYSPNQVGFDFDSNTAHLFSFDAGDAGVTAVPEPATWALAAAGFAILGIKIYSRRRQHQPAA